MPRFPSRSRSKHHDKWLVVIAIYKFLHTLLFALIGIGVLRLVGKDVGDLLSDLADHLHFDPESHLVNFLLDKASLLNDPLLRRIGIVAFSYAAVTLAEGIGLYLEQAWGEYLTLLITASFLPWEIFEIFRRVTLFRVGLLAINLLVFFYLLKVVLSRTRKRARSRKKK